MWYTSPPTAFIISGFLNLARMKSGTIDIFGLDNFGGMILCVQDAKHPFLQPLVSPITNCENENVLQTQ